MTATVTKFNLLPHSRQGIYVDAAAGQYAARVGCDLNERCQRVRSLQRLTSDPEEATLKHIQLQRDWKSTKAEWVTLKEVVRAGLPPHLRNADLSKPFWVKPEWKEAGKANRKQMLLEVREQAYRSAGEAVEGLIELVDADRQTIDRSRASMEQTKNDLRHVTTEEGDLFDRLPPSVRDRLLMALQTTPADIRPGVVIAGTLTIEQAKKRFLADFKNRVGKGNKYGRTDATYNTLANELELALAGIDTKRQVGMLTIADVRAFCGYWMDLEARGIRPRTAENRVNAFRQFLRAMDEDESYGFRMPKGAMIAFAECKAAKSADRITKIDTKALRSMLKVLPEDSRLHVLLSLNCGMYPEDISKLKSDALVDKNGKPYKGKGDAYLKWRRSKARRTNDFDTYHLLWPETYDLLMKCRAAADNAHGRMLLTSAGTPLTSNEADKGRTDTIGMNIRRRCKAEQVNAVPMIQLRKWGATAIARIGGLDVQMMYRAERPRGSSKDYVLFDFIGKLTPALNKWREELKAAKVMDALKDDGGAEGEAA